MPTDAELKQKKTPYSVGRLIRDVIFYAFAGYLFWQVYTCKNVDTFIHTSDLNGDKKKDAIVVSKYLGHKTPYFGVSMHELWEKGFSGRHFLLTNRSVDYHGLGAQSPSGILYFNSSMMKKLRPHSDVDYKTIEDKLNK